MKFVPNAISLKVARQALIAQKHSPTLLFGVGAIAMVASTVLACQATTKLQDVLDETEKKRDLIDATLAKADDPASGPVGKLHEQSKLTYTENDAKKDKAILYVQTGVEVVRLYAPAIICGVAAIGAMAGAQSILTRRNAALTAAFTTLDRTFKEYRQRVRDRYGEDEERDIRLNLREVEFHNTETGKPEKTGIKKVGPEGLSMYARFFDSNSTSWSKAPEYNVVFLRCKQNWVNDQLKARGHMFLNEVYDELGLPRSKEGAVVGWVWSHDYDNPPGDNFIDFGIFDSPASDEVFAFMTGQEGGIWLDFNVDGIIYDKI